jgi:hypothetical protein
MQEVIVSLLIIPYLGLSSPTRVFQGFCIHETFSVVVLISPLIEQVHQVIGVTLSSRLECLLSQD